MEKFTKNDLDYMVDLGGRICDSFKSCNGDCPFCLEDCALSRVKDFLHKEIVITNADKFKEVFGFPLYEVHQLSAQEEGEWLEHEYQEPDISDED